MIESLHISHSLHGGTGGERMRQRCCNGGGAHKILQLILLAASEFYPLPYQPSSTSVLNTHWTMGFLMWFFSLHARRCIWKQRPCLVSCLGVAQRIRVWWRLLFHRRMIWATGQNLPVHSEPDPDWQECLARSGHTTLDDTVWSDVIWQGLLFGDVLNCCCFPCAFCRVWGRGKGGFYGTLNSSSCSLHWVWQNVPEEGWDNKSYVKVLLAMCCPSWPQHQQSPQSFQRLMVVAWIFIRMRKWNRVESSQLLKLKLAQFLLLLSKQAPWLPTRHFWWPKGTPSSFSHQQKSWLNPFQLTNCNGLKQFLF